MQRSLVNQQEENTTTNRKLSKAQNRGFVEEEI